mmetsp:Transcript_7268/g.21386  ORF Transcript_7268/g.21386 Transcript_7268/m.21386 type:complete len:332 (-) Transcript_7268:166-1161(-)
MLAADKDRLIYNIKRQALALRKQELEMIVSRYNNLAGLCSIAAGFSFDALIEIEFPTPEEEEEEPLFEIVPLRTLRPIFYLCTSLALALALYVVAVASFTVVYGHQLALLGSSSGSLDRAVAVMLKQHRPLFYTATGALLAVVGAAVSIAWVKMGHPWAFVATGMFVVLLVVAARTLGRLLGELSPEAMIHGDANVHAGGGMVDLARLNATHGHVVQTHSAEDEALVPGAASGLRSKGYPPPVDMYGDPLEAPRSSDYSRWSPPSSLPSNRTGHSADSAAFGRSGREQRWAPLLRQAGEGTGGGGTGGGGASLLERLVGAPRGHTDDDGSR